MSIADKLRKLQVVKSQIKSRIEEKLGISVGDKFEEYPNYIGQMVGTTTTSEPQYITIPVFIDEELYYFGFLAGNPIVWESTYNESADVAPTTIFNGKVYFGNHLFENHDALLRTKFTDDSSCDVMAQDYIIPNHKYYTAGYCEQVAGTTTTPRPTPTTPQPTTTTTEEFATTTTAEPIVVFINEQAFLIRFESANQWINAYVATKMNGYENFPVRTDAFDNVYVGDTLLYVDGALNVKVKGIQWVQNNDRYYTYNGAVGTTTTTEEPTTTTEEPATTPQPTTTTPQPTTTTPQPRMATRSTNSLDEVLNNYTNEQD